jgi:small conductance mechanosensitive channel
MLEQFLTQIPYLPKNIIYILLFFGAAWVVHRLSRRVAERISRLSRFNRRIQTSEERLHTLRQLVSSAISFVAFSVAALFSLSLFVESDSIIWLVGLFSAAFGLGASPFLRDFLTGASFIFEDTFHVGDKVEILDIEGVVEAVNLRTTWLRASTGELFIIPNGEVRTVRNFSRGRFSTADIKFKISAADLNETLHLLNELSQDAVNSLPGLLEPWRIISDSGVMGQHVELTLLAKARFGRAVELRPHLLTLVQEHLAQAGIALVD